MISLVSWENVINFSNSVRNNSITAMEIKSKGYFDGSEGEFISAKEAKRKQILYLEKSKKDGNDDPIRAQFFGREILEKLLSKKGAMGIRIYQGLDNEGQSSLVLTAVNKEMKNIVLDQSALKDMPPRGDDFGGNGPGCPMNC